MPGWERKLDAPFLMPVSGKYRDLGTIVTGKIESGQVSKGQSVLVMPNKQNAEVLSINIEEAEVKPPVLVTMSAWSSRVLKKTMFPLVSLFVKLIVLSSVQLVSWFSWSFTTFVTFLAPGYTAVLHVHARFRRSHSDLVSEATIDKKTSQRNPKKIMFVRQGEVLITEITAQGTICMEPFSDCPSLVVSLFVMKVNCCRRKGPSSTW